MSKVTNDDAADTIDSATRAADTQKSSGSASSLSAGGKGGKPWAAAERVAGSKLASLSQAYAFLQGLEYAARVVKNEPTSEAAHQHLLALVDDTRQLVEKVQDAERQVQARIASQL